MIIKPKYYLIVFIVGLSGLIVYGTTTYVRMMTERSHAELKEFREKSIRASFSIQSHIAKEMESLYELRDVFQLKSKPLTRSEFRLIAQAILARYKGIQALEWIPYVRHGERKIYEQKARADGIKEFRFKAISHDGEVIQSPVREGYYPVYYVEPYSGNERAVGLDLASSEPRKRALLKSLRTNKAVASESITLVQEKEQQQGVLVFLPLKSQQNFKEQSLLLGVFRIRDMLGSAFANGLHPDLKIYVYDLDGDNNLYPLTALGNLEVKEIPLTIEELMSDDSNIINVTTIDIADRQWAVVIKPVKPIQYNESQYLVWLISFLLISVIILAILFIYFKMRHTESSRKEHIRYQSLSKKLQAILDNTIDGIITIDQKGIIQSVNKSGLRMFGYRYEEMIGQNIKIITPEPVKTEHDSYLKNYLDGGPAKIIGTGRDVEGVRKDGSFISLRLGISEAKINGDIFFIGLLHDISERKNHERLKDEFISTVNHELRTPLTSILGSIQLIQKAGSKELSESCKKLLDIAEKNTHRIIRIVNDILDLQKINTGDMPFDFEAVCLIELVRQSIEECQPYADQYNIKINFFHSAGGVNVTADPLRITQVITNLLSNAIKFTPEDTTVTLCLELIMDSNLVRLSVEDEGPGIPEEFMDKVFQRFTQAESHMTRKASGTGLGLNISQSIIEKHGGTIAVKNSDFSGAHFYFDLPMSNDE